jgi:hypothetical protein
LLFVVVVVIIYRVIQLLLFFMISHVFIIFLKISFISGINILNQSKGKLQTISDQFTNTNLIEKITTVAKSLVDLPFIDQQNESLLNRFYHTVNNNLEYDSNEWKETIISKSQDISGYLGEKTQTFIQNLQQLQVQSVDSLSSLLPSLSSSFIEVTTSLKVIIPEFSVNHMSDIVNSTIQTWFNTSSIEDEDIIQSAIIRPYKGFSFVVATSSFTENLQTASANLLQDLTTSTWKPFKENAIVLAKVLNTILTLDQTPSLGTITNVIKPFQAKTISSQQTIHQIQELPFDNKQRQPIALLQQRSMKVTSTLNNRLAVKSGMFMKNVVGFFSIAVLDNFNHTVLEDTAETTVPTNSLQLLHLQLFNDIWNFCDSELTNYLFHYKLGNTILMVVIHAAALRLFVWGAFYAIGLSISGPIAGSWFASSMGAGLVAGSYMSMLQSVAMTAWTYGIASLAGAGIGIGGTVAATYA